jgi:type IV secretion system protein VirB11
LIALHNHLKYLTKYLTKKDEQGNLPSDIIIKDKVIEIYHSENLSIIKDKIIDEDYIFTLSKLIATHNNESFDSSEPILKSNLPKSLNRYTSIHKSLNGDNLTIIVIRIQNYIDIPTIKSFTENKDYEETILRAIKDGKNILISGETGSGKTTLLNSMVNLFPDLRLITIENSLEIAIPKNISSYQRLIKTTNKITNCTYPDLINAAMRLNPKRLIIGEIDTENTQTYLRVCNTGHKGVYTTIHSNNCLAAIYAIELNLKLNGNSIPQEELFSLIKNSIDIVIQIDKRKIIDIQFTKNLFTDNTS